MWGEAQEAPEEVLEPFKEGDGAFLLLLTLTNPLLAQWHGPYNSTIGGVIITPNIHPILPYKVLKQIGKMTCVDMHDHHKRLQILNLYMLQEFSFSKWLDGLRTYRWTCRRNFQCGKQSHVETC